MILPPFPRRPGNREQAPDADQDHWLSYSDLMAGLMMVFALMLLVALYSYQSGVEGLREVLQIREEVVETLRDEFQEGEVRLVEVQPDGMIRFADQVLFPENSAVLSEQGREQLRTFARQYIQILFADPRFAPFRDQLESIVVEGHTNDNGAYAYNLRLSQERAYAVMDVLLSESAEFEEDIQRSVTANGRSFAALVCLDGTVDLMDSVSPERRCAEQGGVDKEGSRRIEIRFQLRDRDFLQALLEVIDQR